MSKVAVGVFVPCADEIPRGQAQVDAVRDAALTPATVGTPDYPHRPSPPGTGLPWWPCCGGGSTPPTVTPPVIMPPPAPVPLPATGWLLLAAMIAPLWQAAGRFGEWFTAERGAGPGKNGWV